MAIWGNHSPRTNYPDLFNAKVKGERASGRGRRRGVGRGWSHPAGHAVRTIPQARGASSAASAASAAIDHVYDWVNGTAEGDLVSMAVPSDGSYDVPEGIITLVPGDHGQR